MNLNLVVKQFFNENEYNRIAKRLLLMRHDGINVYSNYDDENEAASIGALVSGVWQAAESLSGLIKKENEFFEFRLGFDTTSDGLYILPINILESQYFICAIYTDVDNPGKLKRSIRLLNDSLETFLSEFTFDVEENRKGYLFENITDSEMDKLYSHGGL